MKNRKFTNIVWKEGKYYVSQCLNIDVSSFGKTKKEALRNLEEALELYLEDISKLEIIKIEQPSINIQELKYA
ncbi:type II toxin-antitoxin system HicB family antitoxin [Patescibacteria group bacterium]|nr:type II toxin-antitoxin system HicB family antitoxin [Patescibacteria group bacterium]MBU4458530.1 type II toxin-antitoxin system HicB family antitoxin [Patescibacteria group bacterium]